MMHFARLLSLAVAPSTTAFRTRRLGSSQLVVTEACLGTMTWGVQNTEAEAHEQLDFALKERGVTMVDTAELYPVPLTAPEWQAGRTEEYIGTWLEKNPEWRSKIVLATKICGFMARSKVAAARTEPPTDPRPDCRLDRESVRAACEASLRRLKTDYIDLYQLHWPDRYVPIFGGTVYDASKERDSPVPIEETAAALKELLDEGKIKAYGLSNETPYGLCKWCEVAAAMGLPPPATIQNAYSLLTRSFESGLAEACAPHHYNVGLLPWSVLCGGLLSGKYGAKASVPPAGERAPHALAPRVRGGDRILEPPRGRDLDRAPRHLRGERDALLGIRVRRLREGGHHSRLEVLPGGENAAEHLLLLRG